MSNSIYSFQGVRYGSKLLHLLTRQKKFMIGSIMKLQNKMVNLRLLWTLLHIEKLKGALANEEEKDDVLFGTLDSWLIFKFSGEKKLHMSNISNAAATGITHQLITCSCVHVSYLILKHLSQGYTIRSALNGPLGRLAFSGYPLTLCPRSSTMQAITLESRLPTSSGARFPCLP